MDGHGGSWVSTALKQHLHDRLKQANLVLEENAQADLAERYTKVYADLDATLLEKLAQGAGTTRDGSTCVTFLMNPHHIAVSHVGDSRCVIGMQNGSVRVTLDHEPDLPSERAKIEARGGSVEFHPTPGAKKGGGVHRVNKDLCMSRSFGDPRCKGVIDCVPDVIVYPDAFGVETLVVASDGLWHHLSNEEAINIASKPQFANCEEAAKALYAELWKRIHKNKDPTFGRDNTMIVVGRFNYGSHSKEIERLSAPL